MTRRFLSVVWLSLLLAACGADPVDDTPKPDATKNAAFPNAVVVVVDAASGTKAAPVKVAWVAAAKELLLEAPAVAGGASAETATLAGNAEITGLAPGIYTVRMRHRDGTTTNCSGACWIFGTYSMYAEGTGTCPEHDFPLPEGGSLKIDFTPTPAAKGAGLVTQIVQKPVT